MIIWTTPTLRFRRAATAALLCLAALSLCNACGKSGYPSPRDHGAVFTWSMVEAVMVGNCIAFSGAFAGAYKYFDGVRVELSRLNDPGDCPGCPFVTEEVAEIPLREAGFDEELGTLSFTYCPRPANAYRWRLAAMSKNSKLPHATMIDRLVITAPEEKPVEADGSDGAR
ncbi:MAG: hypothetical protein LBH65_00895 [Desulfovibrio sp.]|jgi:hypothetical protein|nr:hypothetical protein [Desulfovibrio sp.]